MPFRQKTEAGLAAFADAFAPKSARADRNLGLYRVVTVSLRISFRLQERINAFLLIRLEIIPSGSNGQYTQNCRAGDPFGAQSTQKQTDHQDGYKGHCRTQIRLEH